MSDEHQSHLDPRLPPARRNSKGSIMKIHLIYRAVIVSLPFLLSACSKQEEQSAPAVTQKPAAEKAVADVVKETKDSAQATVNQASKEVDKAVDTVKNAAPPAPGSTTFQTWYEKVKGLVADQKYTEAAAALTELPASLTPEQQKMVDQLKAQVQQALSKQSADQGLKAVGGLLNKKN
jgi:hypothetical protein